MQDLADEKQITHERAALSTRGLTKRFGANQAAVEDLDLTVRHGETYGLLGPNGAGKTTTLRMFLGLTKPSEGEIEVLDQSPGTFSGLSSVGALVETPAFYPYLSGRKNLELMASLSGVQKDSGQTIDTALRQVGMERRASEKFKKYSLGMKQRLGIASALLGEPEVLFLDEPTNGLDPRGVAEMRELIRELGRKEITILLSSHMLVEVEHVCDRVGMLSRGRLVSEGSVDELRGSHEEVVLRAEPSSEARRIVTQASFDVSDESESGELKISAKEESIPELARLLVEAGVGIRELRPERRSLEDAYLEVAGSEDD